jgi:hypothetical protein
MLMAIQYSACRGDSGPVSVRSCSARAVVNWEAFPGLELELELSERKRERTTALHIWRRPPINRQQRVRQKERPPRAVDDMGWSCGVALLWRRGMSGASATG